MLPGPAIRQAGEITAAGAFGTRGTARGCNNPGARRMHRDVLWHGRRVARRRPRRLPRFGLYLNEERNGARVPHASVDDVRDVGARLAVPRNTPLRLAPSALFLGSAFLQPRKVERRFFSLGKTRKERFC